VDGSVPKLREIDDEASSPGSAEPAEKCAPTPFVVYGSRMPFEARPAAVAPAAPSAGMRRIRELGLKIEGSPIEPLVTNLYRELADAGVTLRPPVFIADEWGCPDGVPAIGIPFYLVDRDLAALEEKETEELESEEDIKRCLRHEAGHAFCYAHKLYLSPTFRDLFGPLSRPYLEDFQPMPFSRAFVRHLPGWYAQKHPDEDFAETFAVFITPGSDWKKQYQAWPALKKLSFLEDAVGSLGKAEPAVVPQNEYLVDEGLDLTVPEHYEQRRDESRVAQIGEVIDADLVRLFGSPNGVPGEAAGKFVRQQRRSLVMGAAYWTGARTSVVRGLIDHIAQRADALGLTVLPERSPEVTVSLSALVTTLALNHLLRGKFVEP
jgi:hypothetical protein